MCILLVVSASTSVYANVKINELQYWKNDTGLEDVFPSFIELFNAGNEAQNLMGWWVGGLDSTQVFELPNLSLPNDAYLMVYLNEIGLNDFDFTDGVGSYFPMNDWDLIINEGEIGLYNGIPSAINMVDFVVWADGAPNFGEAYANAIEAGMWTENDFVDVSDFNKLGHIALLPDGNDWNMSADWKDIEQQLVLPITNRNILQLYPKDGTAHGDGAVTFEWQSVNFAVAYQLLVDDNQDFTSPEIDVIIADTQYTPVNPLNDGEYYWKVISDFGAAKNDSDNPLPTSTVAVVVNQALLANITANGNIVSVPQYYQHKDTRLLCIWDAANNTRPGCTENAGRHGPWDNTHLTGAHIPRCNHCRNYCTRAAIQMVNHHYGGSLTQDEISYHFYQNRHPGPEGDLGHQIGAWPERNNTYSWALKGAAVTTNAINPIAAIPWNTLKNEINAKRPVLSVIRPPGWNHTVVVNGFIEIGMAIKLIRIQDPWPNRSGWFSHARVPLSRYYILPAGEIKGRKTDPFVASDFDNDGVKDFDEQKVSANTAQTVRTFCSNFKKIDTDKDEVNDKQEIRSYTFHDTDHAGHNNDALDFPDVDGDAARAECDCDTDNDADFDGGEDVDGDGKSPEAGETCVYDATSKNIGVVTDKLIYLPLEDVLLSGGTLHANSTYTYDIIGDCPDLIDKQGLGNDGTVTTDAAGQIPATKIGNFLPGLYLVVVDVLKDGVYHEPNCWDPWTCFLVECYDYMLIPDLSGELCTTDISGTIQLNVSGGTPPYTYNWSTGATADVVTNLNEGTYYVQVNDANGCTMTLDYTLTAPNPISINYTLNNESCLGNADGFVEVVASGGTGNYVFDWSNGITEPQNNDLTIGNYTLIVTDDKGCSASYSFDICANDCATVIAQENLEGEPCVSGYAPDGWMVSGFGGTNIWQFDNFMGSCAAVSNGQGIAEFFTNLNTFECINTVLSFEYSFTPDTDAGGRLMVVAFLETLPNPLELWVAQEPCTACMASVTLPLGMYPTDIIGFVHEGMGNNAQAVIDNIVFACDENISMPPDVSAGNDITVCQGEMVVLGGNPSASCGNTPYFYNWLPAEYLSDSTVPNPQFLATTPGLHMFVLEVFDDYGNVGAATVDVFVNPLPEIEFALAKSAIAHCENDLPIELWATPEGGTYTGIGVNGNLFNPTIAGVGTHIITYTVSATGCANSATDTVVVNPTPIVDFYIAQSDVCVDETAIELGSGIPDGGVLSGNGLVGNVFDATAAGVGTHLITYTYTDANNCVAQASDFINVQELPITSVIADQEICSGESVMLMATGGSTYLWTPAVGLNDAYVSNPVASPEETTVYAVEIIADNGCSAIESVLVGVNACATTILAELYLEGAYDADNAEMYTYLRDNNLLPMAQPFGQAPWYYFGIESVSEVGDIPTDVTDWVLLALYNENTNEWVAEKAGFLLKNGTVQAVDGTVGLSMTGLTSGESYIMVARVRNHLAVASAQAINIPQTGAYAFTEPNNVLGGEEQLVPIGGGLHGLIAGDIDANGVITLSDFNGYLNQTANTNQYVAADCNLDGSVTVADFNAYQANASAIGVNLVRY